jgi:hypothetical protein
MNFKSIILEEVCPSLTYKFKVANLRDTSLVEILVVSFHGIYRNGSAGRPDAGFIKGIINTGLSVFDPFSLLIDLSDLKYNWGDDLDILFNESENVNTVVLVGEECRKAMSSLAFGVGTNKDIVDNAFYFDNFEKAIAKLKEK